METIIAAIIGVFGSVIGGAVGGYLAIRASRRATAEAYENNLKLQQKAQNQAIRGVLLGLHAEIISLKTIYEKEFSGGEITLLVEGQAFEYGYPISRNYFTLYKSNASLIGQIPDDELRSLIIEIYQRMNALIDTHLYNNKLLDKRDELLDLNPNTDKDEVLLEKIKLANQNLAEYGINIRENYEELLEVFGKYKIKVEIVIQSLSDETDNKKLTS